MVEDRRLESKLSDLARELMNRPLVPGFPIVDAFTMRGADEAGRPGMFAAVLLQPGPAPDLEALTALRQVLSQRLKQLDTTLPAWPIVVQGAPELMDGREVIPGGVEYFNQLKRTLEVRKPRPSYSSMPVIIEPAPKTGPQLRVPSRSKKRPVEKSIRRKSNASARSARSRR